MGSLKLNTLFNFQEIKFVEPKLRYYFVYKKLMQAIPTEDDLSKYNEFWPLD